MSIFGGSSTEEEESEENNEEEPEEIEEPEGEEPEEEPVEIEDPEEEESEEESEGAVDGAPADSEQEPEEVEVVEPEVVSDPEEPEDLPAVTFGDSELSTFTVNFNSFAFKIIPRSQSSGVRWGIAVYGNGIQGPLLQKSEPITEAEADEFGLPEQLRVRINEGLMFAKRNLDLPPALRSETSDRSLEDLEMLMEERG